MPESPTSDPKESRSAPDYDQLADSLRSRLDLFGKSIAGLGTLGTGAISLATASDLSPRGPGSALAAIIALLGLGAAAWGAVWIATSLMKVNRPVVLEADEQLIDELAGKLEKADVKRIYDETAHRFGTSSLVALQDRGSALREAASRALSDDERARRTALAEEAEAAIQTALARARWAVVRRRSSDAASGPDAQKSYVLVAAGLLAFAFFSDIATTNQTDDIATAKLCAEARDAGATEGDLKNTVCPEETENDDEDEADADETPVLTSGEAEAATIEQLALILKACYALARPEDGETPKGPLEKAFCDDIRDAGVRLLSR